MRTFSEAIAMLAWVTGMWISAIGPWVPEPLEPFVAIGFYSIMILGVGDAGFAGYLTRNNGPSSDDTGFKIVGVLLLAGLALFVGG
jgi:hypothetical protein